MSKRKENILAVLACLIGLGFPVFIQFTISGISYLIKMTSSTSTGNENLMQTSAVIGYLVIGGIYAIFYKLIIKQGRLGEKMTAISAIRCSILGAGTAGISILWLMMGGKIPVFEESLRLLENIDSNQSKGLINLIVLPVIMAPIVEELVFRGIVFNSLKKVISVSTAVLLSALLFGIAHMILVQSVYTFLMGIIVAVVYARTRNLAFPIIIHIVNNLIASAQIYFPSAEMAINIFVFIMMLPSLWTLIRLLRTRNNLLE